MKISVPLYKTSCLINLLAIIAILMLTACSATVVKEYANGDKTTINVPYSYRYDAKNEVVESDARIVKATSDAMIEIAKHSPEIIQQIIEQQQRNQQKQQQ